MNKQNRKMIEGYISSLEDIKQNIESLLEDEKTKFANMPEGFQESERGYAILFAIKNLGSAPESIRDAIDSLNDAME